MAFGFDELYQKTSQMLLDMSQPEQKQAFPSSNGSKGSLTAPHIQMNFAREQELNLTNEEIERQRLQFETEAKLEKYKKDANRRIVLDFIDTVSPSIKVQISKCSDLKKLYRSRYRKFDEQRSLIATCKSMTQDSNSEVEARLAGLNKQFVDAKKVLEEKHDAIVNRIQEANKRKSTLKKWCWVPFYSIYLLAEDEYLTKEDKSELKKLEDKKNAAYEEYHAYEMRIIGDSVFHDNIQSLLNIIEQESQINTDRLNQISLMLAEWNQFYLYLNRLKTEVDTVDQIVQLMDQFHQETWKAHDFENKIAYEDYKNPEYFMNDCKISTSDDTYQILCTSTFLSLAKKNIDLSLYAIKQYVTPYYRIITLTGMGSIILNDRYDILTCQDHGFVAFQPLRREIQENQLLHIRRCPDDPNSYYIENERYSYFDVYGGTYDTGIPLCTWDFHDGMNQRFHIEIEDLGARGNYDPGILQMAPRFDRGMPNSCIEMVPHFYELKDESSICGAAVLGDLSSVKLF